MKKVLTIAGSDSSGGAGIQADIKTITVHNMYAMSVITSLTAQNTTGVFAIEDVSREMVEKQIDAVFTDIRPDAVKIGMVSNPEIIMAIADKLDQYKASNIVLDPVMVSTSGSRLINEEAIGVLVEKLFPMAAVITPNIPEAEVLSGLRIRDSAQMVQAAEKIGTQCSCSVLIKGGHSINDAVDILYEKGEFHWFHAKRIINPNTHGTGCTLSSAIACGLAEGYSLKESIRSAKEYLTGALKAGLDLGNGSGPLNHMYEWNAINKIV